MDPNLQSPQADNVDTKAAFRKPTIDAASRKYRRPSSVSASPSSDGSQGRGRSTSPVSLEEPDSRTHDHRQKRKDGGRESDADLGQKHYRRDSDLYRQSDRQPARSSHGYKKHEGYVRHDRRDDFQRSSYLRKMDRHAPDKHDASSSPYHQKYRYIDRRRDHHRSLGNYRSDLAASHGECRGTASREQNHLKELDGQKYSRENKKTYDERDKEREESSSKKMKLCSANEGIDTGKDGSGNDVDAAKVAAMKAAELVNRNLSGVGCMSTEQKKKLLWGNKKSSPAEERWDGSMFGDPERQEKFNKLMGVKGEVKKGDGQGAEKQKEVQLDLEKQYTAGLRRRDGRTVGLGL